MIKPDTHVGVDGITFETSSGMCRGVGGFVPGGRQVEACWDKEPDGSTSWAGNHPCLPTGKISDKTPGEYPSAHAGTRLAQKWTPALEKPYPRYSSYPSPHSCPVPITDNCSYPNDTSCPPNSIYLKQYNRTRLQLQEKTADRNSAGGWFVCVGGITAAWRAVGGMGELRRTDPPLP